MRTQLLCTALAIGAASTIALAQRNARQAQPANANVESALKSQFPNATISIGAEHTVNGVRTYDITVTPANGAAETGEATEQGEILTLTEGGGNASNLPPGAREFTEGIWRTPPSQIRRMMGRYYWVTIGGAGARNAGLAEAAGSTLYELQFDATGRLLDIKSPTQLHASNWRNMPEAPADVKAKLQQFAQQHWPQSKPVDVKQIPGTNGFYQVRATINNTDAWIDTDANGDIASEASTVQVSQLPRPVQDAINNTFKGDKVVWAARNDVHFYEINETVENQMVTMRIEPDGDVLRVHTSAAAEGRAIPAAGRTGRTR